MDTKFKVFNSLTASLRAPYMPHRQWLAHSRSSRSLTAFMWAPVWNSFMWLKSSCWYSDQASIQPPHQTPFQSLAYPNEQPQRTVLFYRFALFLYGSQVSQVSVFALQYLPDRIHATQLYRLEGGRGLSWVPASVTVRAEHVEDVSLPLVLAVRARRGPGPEGDIALDHLSVLAGPCHLHPSLQPNLTLHPILAHPDALALTAGPALTPLPARDPPDDPAHPSEDLCTSHTTCSSCVAGQGEDVHVCTWCDLTQRCVGGRSPAAAACPQHLAIHHNTSVSCASVGIVPCYFGPQVLVDSLLLICFSHPLLASSLIAAPLFLSLRAQHWQVSFALRFRWQFSFLVSIVSFSQHPSTSSHLPISSAFPWSPFEHWASSISCPLNLLQALSP